ncbi:hypothetical protein [Candidatus Solirubrobacter pratensis]|uniref:hypothetical protein n=1 Tax=Candidatus Solirubrobacter pratensis TaxID=1298857 RepID=UPI000404BC7A|nr:hypothetical protein [Candidatus Solirubrobacter pratensis]
MLCTLAAVTVAASLLFTATAGAHGTDRNRDRIPDRWEKQHHLSLKVKETRRDQDRDGLNNLGEYRSHTDPRDGDSDDDGIGDDAENAGKVASFTGGVLTITLAKGGTLTGQVTDETEIECEGDATATSSGDDPGDDDQGDDDNGGRDHGGDDDDHGDGGHGSCGAEALAAGRQVGEAELKASHGVAVFEQLELGA